MTRPQTLGYGLADSPVGQAAWIYEKMWAWTDNQGNPEDALTLDEMLDNIMLYWLPGTATSSARLYWESFAIGVASVRLEIPVGVSVYPRETIRPSRRWVDRWIPNLIHYNILERGGHFAAWEQPALHAKEIRDCFAKVRWAWPRQAGGMRGLSSGDVGRAGSPTNRVDGDRMYDLANCGDQALSRREVDPALRSSKRQTT